LADRGGVPSLVMIAALLMGSGIDDAVRCGHQQLRRAFHAVAELCFT